MKLSDYYHHDVTQADFVADEAQSQVLAYLQVLTDDLVDESHTERSLISQLLHSVSAKNSTTRGLYLWGSVGTGKTYLMDLFFNHLPVTQKYRIHFHAFMQEIHRQLHQLTGHKNPVEEIAHQLATKARVICLDEFLVHDVMDAMVLTNLFSALSKHGICLVITSNIAPGDLYKNGVQRDYFLPTIDFIKQSLCVMCLQSPHDYRLRTLAQASICHIPINAQSDAALAACFQSLTAQSTTQSGLLSLNARTMMTLGYSAEVLWCDFHVLCVEARSNQDYLELARIYHTIVLRGIPQMDDTQRDAAKRFIHLIDTLYDHRVKFIWSAQTSVDLLYHGTLLQSEIKRAQSRLMEMQSMDYLASAHNSY